MSVNTTTNIYTVLKKLPSWFLFVIILSYLFIHFLLDGGLAFFSNKKINKLEKQISEKVVFLTKEHEKYKDSINNAEQKRLQELAFVKVNEIYELMDDMQIKLPECNTIAVYYIHDSGGVPVSGGNLNLTVVYEKRSGGIPSLKRYWKSEPLPEGYFYYNKFVYDYGFKYINNVENYAKIYIKDTKPFLKLYNTKSLYGVFLDQSVLGTWYLSFGFAKKDPFTNNEVLRIKMNQYAKQIRPLLQLKRPLK